MHPVDTELAVRLISQTQMLHLRGAPNLYLKRENASGLCKDEYRGLTFTKDVPLPNAKYTSSDGEELKGLSGGMLSPKIAIMLLDNRIQVQKSELK